MSGSEHAKHPRGLKRWLFTTNHKDIGTLFNFRRAMFLLGGGQAMTFSLYG